MTASVFTVAELRPVDLFDDIDDARLQEWADVAYERIVAPGEVFIEQGADPLGLQLLLEGTARTVHLEGDRVEPIGQQIAPTWIGAIPTLVGTPLAVQISGETRCRLAIVAPDDLRRLALAQPEVHRKIMAQVTPVIGRFSAMEQNRDRLASLGTMAAGLAHELNNPAAAARRAAEQMAEAIDVVSSALGRFVESGIEREDAELLLVLQREAMDGAAGQGQRDTLDMADAEDELRDALEARGVPEPWRLAEPLAAAGVDAAWVDRVAAIAGSATDAAVGWVAASITARGLADELRASTERMSDLVTAVKTYAYMDRGDLVEIDLHEGLDTTLVVLGHKLKHTAINVVRDYDEDLPKLTVRGSELNQVWTNLLDNAIDALGEQGTITITTRHDDTCVLVDVSDDGPGMSPEVRERAFDTFFTTKDVGAGTGLGLSTARQIVVGRHDGSLTIDSRPGETTFHVSLPRRRD